MRFDWWQATVLEPSDRFLGWVAGAYPDCQRIEAKGLNGYAFRADFMAGGIRQVSVSYGGHNPMPNAMATGPSAPRFAELVRGSFPKEGQIRVTRVDACEDFDQPGAWESVQTALWGIAQQRSLVTEHAGDWDRGEKGRSYYVGSRTSAFRVVAYEKGVQLARELAASGEAPRPDWVRLEGRLKPQSPDAKITAAGLTPEQVWGCARWAPSVLQAVLERSVQRVHMSEYRVPDATMARWQMVRQYRRILQGWVEEVGGDITAFGDAIVDMIASMEGEEH